MSVKSLSLPSFTDQDATTYKVSIDSTLEICTNLAGQFSPSEMDNIGLGISISSGLLMDGTIINKTNVTGFISPSANSRIDRVYYNLNTRTFEIAQGIEAESPNKPSIPYGVFPICRIHFTPGMSEITNDDITDERTLITAPVSFLSGNGYTSIVDPIGTSRILIGTVGINNEIIIRLHTSDMESKLVIKNSNDVNVMTIDAEGNIICAGSITSNTNP